MTISIEQGKATLLTVSEDAREQLKGVLLEEGNPNVALRVFVNGAQAAMELDDVERENDMVMDFDGLKVLVDPFSAQYLSGAVIGFQDTLMQRGFTIEGENLPKAQGGGCCGGSCGCGH